MGLSRALVEPVIITVATTGGGTTREQTPYLPSLRTR